MFDVSSWVMHLSPVILFAYSADITLQQDQAIWFQDQAIWFNFIFLKCPIKISVGTVYSFFSPSRHGHGRFHSLSNSFIITQPFSAA